MVGQPRGTDGVAGRILLVEDNEDLRLATRELLEGLGHEVVTAGSAEKVAMLPDELCHGIGLLLVNAYLVSGSGVTVVDDFRHRGFATPALLYSGYGDDGTLLARADRGEMGFLELPFAAQALEKQVREALSGAAGYYAPPAVARVLPMPEPKPTASRRPAPWRYAAAAALVIGAGVVFLLGRSASPPLPPLEESQVVRGSAVELVGPLGELAEAPRRFEWEPFHRAAGYRLALTGVDDRVLWEGETSAAALDAPDELAALVHSAVVYYWKVDALDDAGVRIGWSDRGRFRVSPAPPGGG